MTAISGGFSADIRSIIPDVVKFLVRWHQNLKSNLAPILTDHILYRVVTGILVAAPEEIKRSESSFVTLAETLEVFQQTLSMSSLQVLHSFIGSLENWPTLSTYS